MSALRMINASTGLGRVSLITGGASPVGLGAAAGRVFAREGAKVVIADLPSKEASGQAVVAELNKIRAGSAIWVPLDVTKEAEWDRAVGEIEKKLGPLDVLFNNAGISGELNGPPEKAEDADIKKFLQIMDVNVTGVLLGLKYASRSMKKNTAEEWRSIIMTSSVAGLTGSPAVPWGYTASKWAVRGLTRHAAQIGAVDKIRVNSIHPGVIVSDMTVGADWVDHGGKTRPGVGEMLNSLIPLGRAGWPSEVAAAVLFLASPESSYVSGQGTTIDGAFHNA